MIIEIIMIIIIKIIMIIIIKIIMIMIIEAEYVSTMKLALY